MLDLQRENARFKRPAPEKDKLIKMDDGNETEVRLHNLFLSFDIILFRHFEKSFCNNVMLESVIFAYCIGHGTASLC